MQETLVPAPLLTAATQQTIGSVSSAEPSASAAVLDKISPDAASSVSDSSASAAGLALAADASQPGVLELTSEEATQQLQASQEMGLVAGKLTKADAHWLRDASSLSLDELAGRLRRLDDLEQQTEAYVQKLNSAQAENDMLQKTAEQSLQLQYLGFGLAALFALAYAYARLRRKLPQADAAASSILFGDSLSAQKELELARLTPRPAPNAQDFLAQQTVSHQPQEEKAYPAQTHTEEIQAESRFDSLGQTATAADAAISAEDDKELRQPDAAQLLTHEAARTAPFLRKESWYRRLFSSADPAETAFADAAVGADIPALSDDERDERIDSVWEDSKDWLREERILAERELQQPVAALLAEQTPLTELAPNTLRQAAPTFLVNDLAPQPGQALIDYIRSLHRIVQRLLDQGQYGQAGIMLYEHVRLVPQTSPWAYLAFLSLYHEPTVKYLEMRQWFLERFGREAPHIGEERSNLALARGIADYQYSMAQLSQSWPGERAVMLLEEWLAVSNKRIFTLYAYNELFMLYDVLEDLHGLSHGTNFQPLTA